MAQEYFPWSSNSMPSPRHEYFMEILAGNVENADSKVIPFHNSAVGTSYETIWEEGALVAFPASASTMTVSSDNVNDTSAGTGARTVVIQGLDTDYIEISEVVSLNGTTAVTTTKSFLRVNRLVVLTAGSGRKNTGIVYIGTGTVTAGKPAVVVNLISTGDSASHSGFYTVPANKHLFFTLIAFTAEANKNVSFQIIAHRPEGVEVVVSEYKLDVDLMQDLRGRARFNEKVDIETRAKVASSTADVKAVTYAIQRNADET